MVFFFYWSSQACRIWQKVHCNMSNIAIGHWSNVRYTLWLFMDAPPPLLMNWLHKGSRYGNWIIISLQHNLSIYLCFLLCASICSASEKAFKIYTMAATHIRNAISHSISVCAIKEKCNFCVFIEVTLCIHKSQIHEHSKEDKLSDNICY